MNNNKVRYVQGEKGGYAITIKISNDTVLKSMQKGELWFQSPKYYQEYSKNDVIGDINECAFESIVHISQDEAERYIQLKKGDVILIDGKKFCYEKILDGILYVISNNQNDYRLLCFYTLYFDENRRIIRPDERIKQFGTSFSIIQNRERLVQMIGNKVERENYNLSFTHTKIAYISENYRGVYTPGCKFMRYRYQNEYRFILCSKTFENLPEKKEKRMVLPEIFDEKLFSDPIPVDVLWKIEKLEDLENY